MPRHENTGPGQNRHHKKLTVRSCSQSTVLTRRKKSRKMYIECRFAGNWDCPPRKNFDRRADIQRRDYSHTPQGMFESAWGWCHLPAGTSWRRIQTQKPIYFCTHAKRLVTKHKQTYFKLGASSKEGTHRGPSTFVEKRMTTDPLELEK